MHWNVAAYRRHVFEELDLHVQVTDRVLDLGCGDGGDAALLADRAREVTGVDLVLNPNWTSLARPGLQFLQGDGEALTFPDGAFDLVFLKDVLHHSPQPHKLLREARRLCAAGGRVCVVEANRYNPIFYVHMTLMLGHQHLRRPVFERLIRDVFPHARWYRFEAHVYPLEAPALLRLTRAIETLIAATPAVRRMASYNAAVAFC